MNENEKEKALEDLRVIKIMMEAANRAVVNNGTQILIFGVFWLVSSLIIYFPGCAKLFRSAPYIFVPLWIGFVLACTIFLSLYKRRSMKQEQHSGLHIRYEKQMREMVLIALVLSFVSFFVVQRLNLGPGAGLFVISLVLGLTFYFIGIVWTAEFRITGLFLFAGVALMPYVKGYEQLVFGLTYGVGAIVTGCFLRRRWLKLKRQEKTSVSVLN